MGTLVGRAKNDMMGNGGMGYDRTGWDGTMHDYI